MNINKLNNFKHFKNTNLVAIICMLLSSLSFSIMQFCVKLTPDITLMQKILVRNFFSLILSLIIIYKKKLLYFGMAKNQKYLFTRSISGVVGVILFFWGTMKVNLSDAAILNKLSPFIIIILSHFFLKEKIRTYHIIAISIAILGSYFIIRPKFSSSFIPYIILITSAIMSAIAFTSLKALGERENTYTIVFHYSLISVIVSFPFICTNFNNFDIKNILFLLCIGIFSCIGQVSLTLAYKYGKASDVSIYDYTNIIFSSLLGFFFLNESLESNEILGGVLIILSSLIIYFFSKKQKK